MRPRRPPPPLPPPPGVAGRESSGLTAVLIGPDFWSGLIAPRGHWLIAARSRPPIGRRHRRLRERPPTESDWPPPPPLPLRLRAHRRSARRPPHGRPRVESRSSNDGGRSGEQKSRSLPAAPERGRDRPVARRAGALSPFLEGKTVIGAAESRRARKQLRERPREGRREEGKGFGEGDDRRGKTTTASWTRGN